MNHWKKKLLSLTVALALLTTALPVAAAAAPSATSIKINNEKVEYSTGAPIIERNTTYVPLRSTLEAMDAKLATANNDTIVAVVDGKKITLKSKLKRVNGVTYAPIRVVGDATGYDVRWDQATRTVLLVSKGNSTETAKSVGRGFMWEVENGKTTVYLVGSMHLADDSFYPLRAEYEEAFKEADYLGVEIDISKAADEEQQNLMVDMGMYQDGTTLKDHISADTYKKLGVLLKENGMEANALDAFKPWIVETTLSSLKSTEAGFDAAAGVDLYFIQKALERKMPIIELESYESQLGMFAGFSKELQEETLLSAIENFDVIDQSVKEMANMWVSGDEEQLLELTNSMSGNEEYNKAMLIDRNIEMAKKIDGYLNSGKEEEYFIVVGAAHYLGEHGIIKLLQDKGYSVSRK
ncbi:TraB/GumN family protein [Paenibacillus yanchengensis]|uniref:TraB/GumN family protein n=1 Tax=Paenibacillus yanchengensis TaxID=2035833 RepID=A0ABW4YJ49_9BACL